MVQPPQPPPNIFQAILNGYNTTVADLDPAGASALPPAWGEYPNEQQAIDDYLMTIRNATHLVNTGVAQRLMPQLDGMIPPPPPQYNVNVLPIFFISPRTRTRYCTTRWAMWQYQSLQAMESCFNTIAEAAANYRPGEINLFFFYGPHNRNYLQSSVYYVLHNNPPGVNINHGYSAVEMGYIDHLHGTNNLQPHAMALRIDPGGAIRYYDPWYDAQHNPAPMPPGSNGHRRLSDLWYSNIVKAFLAELHRLGHPLSNQAQLEGGGEFPFFDRDAVEASLSWMRDQIWTDLSGQRQNPLYPAAFPPQVITLG